MGYLDGSYAEGSFKFTSFNFTADSDNTAVAAVAGKKIRVVSYQLNNVTTAGVVTVKDGTGGSTIGVLTFTLGQAQSFGGGLEGPAFETSAGNALVLSNATNVDTTGHLTYVLVT